MVGSCCILLHTTDNMHATTSNIVGATMLGVVAFVCTQPKNQGKCTVRTPQRSCLLFYHFVFLSFKGLGLGIFSTLGLYKLLNYKMVKETFFFEKKKSKKLWPRT